jgi:hypothetical protein
MHDDRPTLNGEGYPLDVFESPRSVTFPAWQAGADRAAGVSAYVGLLVSMHVLSLSALAAGMAQERRAKGAFDPSQLTDQFEMNKFQHREIERQEQLRRRLGLRTDLPVHLGLAELNVDPAEDELRADLRWLQAMDLISLALCCTSPPAGEASDVYERPGGAATSLHMRRAGPDVIVEPWPFGKSEIDVEIPARRVPRHRFDDVMAFRRAYAAAPVEVLRAAVRPV